MTSLARGEAYAILELPVGADLDAVRTSYKRLAQKWHPEKNQKSPSDSYQKFLRISMAYKRLSTDNENVAMTRAQVLELYKKMLPAYQEDTDEESDSSNQDSCTSESDDEHARQFSLGRNGLACEDEDGFSAQKREQIANDLITEEEKKKKQQEKRRQKKKQRREKKRLEKQATSDTSTKNNKQANTQKSDKNLQLSTKTKKDKRDEIHIETEQEQASNAGVDSQENNTVLPPQNMIPGDEANIDPVIFRSRQYAIQGNSMACNGQYAAAIEWFTKAIQLDASDYRFFGNRSYCYERLDQFQKALNDAQKALSLAPDWPKGHFRKGRALAGLKNYQAAEEAFAQVIKLDSKCEDARQELNKVRASQLVDMGFSLQQALAAAQQYDSLQQALDSLLAGLVSENPMLDDVYISDDDDDEESAPEISNRHVLNAASISGSHVNSMSSDVISSKTAISQPHTLVATGIASTATSKSSKKSKQPLPPIPQHHYEQAALQIQKNKQSSPFKNTSLMDEFKMNPCNPEGLTSLWVGNVLPSVSQETLTSLFSSCGMLQSIRVLPEKYCAFVNYFSSECAGRAMKDLQGTVLNGQPLLIKFPDNPLTQTANHFEKPKSSAAVKSAPVPVAAVPAAVAAAGKLRGPVNGDECYFWRTTGCQFSGTCRYRHVPENKGIDRKPWQKPTK